MPKSNEILHYVKNLTNLLFKKIDFEVTFQLYTQGNNNLFLKRPNSDWSSLIRKSRNGVEGYNLPPLTKNLSIREDLKQPQSVSSRNYDTHVSQLDNGLKIASEKLFGEFCTVGGK